MSCAIYPLNRINLLIGYERQIIIYKVNVTRIDSRFFFYTTNIYCIVDLLYGGRPCWRLLSVDTQWVLYYSVQRASILNKMYKCIKVLMRYRHWVTDEVCYTKYRFWTREFPWDCIVVLWSVFAISFYSHWLRAIYEWSTISHCVHLEMRLQHMGLAKDEGV